MSGGIPEGKHLEIRTPASWGQGDRGAAGYEDSGGSELVWRDGQLLGGLTSGPSGEPTIDIHGGDRPPARTPRKRDETARTRTTKTIEQQERHEEALMRFVRVHVAVPLPFRVPRDVFFVAAAFFAAAALEHLVAGLLPRLRFSEFLFRAVEKSRRLAFLVVVGAA
jgi:hypothetical protein